MAFSHPPGMPQNVARPHPGGADASTSPKLRGDDWSRRRHRRAAQAPMVTERWRKRTGLPLPGRGGWPKKRFFSEVRDRHRLHRGSEGHVRSGACASRSGHRPGISPADRARLTRPWHEPCPRPSRRVPSDTGCGALASPEDGQPESPLRPAAGVGSRRARRHLRRSTGRAGDDRVIAKLPVSPTDGLRRNLRLPRPSSGAGATADVPAHPF